MSIDAALVERERIARETGAAVGMALPYPVSIERLLAWIPTLPGKGLVLAPVSALAGLQMAQVSAAPAGEADAQVR